MKSRIIVTELEVIIYINLCVNASNSNKFAMFSCFTMLVRVLQSGFCRSQKISNVVCGRSLDNCKLHPWFPILKQKWLSRKNAKAMHNMKAMHVFYRFFCILKHHKYDFWANNYNIWDATESGLQWFLT